ncbi:ABC transporter permease [Oceanobacillus indicireducens]|uniref:Sodium transporter n=1 Tax=Oceanobacillus indicireducens TaxID=1004261 RepID=A0A918CZ34_9BACI|nr:ABC transporter permease [Oceanobacillus indicireducens]GGN50573.1 sodium transporter [Oceanobacillus indicireducens]
MRNAMKVAKWEIKRNMKNKTFLIGLFLTPLLIVGFGLIGSWIGGSSDDGSYEDEMTVFINDEIGIIDELTQYASESGLEWSIEETNVEIGDVAAELDGAEDTAYIFLNEAALNEGVVPVYIAEDVDPFFSSQLAMFQGPILAHQMEALGLTEEQSLAVSRGIQFAEMDAEEMTNDEALEDEASGEDFLAGIVPAAFGGIIFISILFTGMAMFQSASQEKKDKIAEIILSSVTPEELMQGKIIGYFVLGLVQAAVLLVFLVPMILFLTDVPLFEYLFVTETLLFVLLAVLNYLMFAAIFVGIGATIEDVTTSGNFQGIVMMLPFLPFIFIGPVVGDPSGLMAQIGTYIPFTAPGVLLLRLTMLDVWPWLEISISLVIIIVSVLVFIRLAGKIFKVGILMYGKNATPGEIWKWLKA